MFFEASYLPSPQFSVESLDDSQIPEILSPSAETLPPPPMDNTEERHDEEVPSEETPVNHLVFVIHGIGQQTEQYGHFYEHVESLQETTRQVLQAKVPDHNVRIELIPIEWHRHIHDQVDPILNKITLKSIPTIRLIENDYLADVLFYFSKDRGQSIIDNVTRLFNTSYHNFMEKHPDFDGKIVILGYSLGGILTWDILSHQREPSSEEEQLDYNKLDVIYQPLDFKPNYFFTLGSPIGAVLTFRNQSPVTYHPDYDIVFENLFHPFDPLAYRIEPLYDEYYTDQPAVLVDRSAPIGPSFSFPSLPSLPGLGLFSFFSWKTSSTGNDNTTSENLGSETTNTGNIESSLAINNKDTPPSNTTQSPSLASDSDPAAAHATQRSITTTTVTNATATMTTNMDGEDQQQGKSIMNSLLHYFGKGRRESKESGNHHRSTSDSRTDSATVSTASDTYEYDHDPSLLEQQASQDATHGIITWDPLQEQRHVALSLDSTPQTPDWLGQESNDNGTSGDSRIHSKDGMDSLTNSTSTSTNATISSEKRPLHLQRAKTYCAQGIIDSANDEGDAKESIFFYEIDKGMFTTATTDKKDATYSDTHNDDKPPHTELRHLVEVLGIDGVRMESFERAKANFPGSSKNSGNPIEREECRSLDPTNNSNSGKRKNGPLNKTKEVLDEGVAAYTTTPEDITHQTTIDTDKDVMHNDDETNDQPIDESANDSEDDIKAKEEARIQQEALDQLPGKRRMDFALQPDGFMSMIANEYIVGLRAHFSYWTSKDLMWHILQTLEK